MDIAVIFDMDGLLFNTETLFLKGFTDLGKKRGVNIPEYVAHQMIGCDSRTVKNYEEKYPGIIDVMAAFQKVRLDYFFKWFPHPGDGNMPGLEKTISYLNGNNISYAIASSSHTEDIQRLVAYADCDMRPDVIVSSKEDGIPSKPDPTIFKEAARRLHRNAADCLVVEDSKYGIIAGRRAGCQTIFIPDQIEQDRQMYPYVQTKCSDLTGVIEYIENRAE